MVKVFFEVLELISHQLRIVEVGDRLARLLGQTQHVRREGLPLHYLGEIDPHLLEVFLGPRLPGLLQLVVKLVPEETTLLDESVCHRDPHSN